MHSRHAPNPKNIYIFFVHVQFMYLYIYFLHAKEINNPFSGHGFFIYSYDGNIWYDIAFTIYFYMSLIYLKIAFCYFLSFFSLYYITIIPMSYI